jgi:hypothetical protein
MKISVNDGEKNPDDGSINDINDLFMIFKPLIRHILSRIMRINPREQTDAKYFIG